MTPLRPISRTLCAALIGLACAGVAQAQSSMPLTELTAGMYRIEAEVAATPDHRMLGLMKRRSMPANHGMLFIFTELQRHCMWMKNTLLPLSVAFLDEQGRILNIEDMKPQTEDNHCAARPAAFALEMNHGWFRQKGIGPGVRIGGVEALGGRAR
ncbi:DUF192 domain-containing protein [Thauera aminoaromatica]|uniref:DUF192 domain-containing protein n=1 Tax=Thauera aminoaromatica TaxID=164330 RepID=A0A5C7SB34_THASP|nr:DUF192 domain-containing protein [Thauera aminoaromatica]TXH80917.1 MAG: DUF192 domain-containing protein [Thauera aminoaromatica]